MNLKHLFLFEYIKKDQKIIIYGLGSIGNGYIEQIEGTHWCDIVGVCDQTVKSQQYRNFTIMQLAAMEDYDYIVIAIQSLEVASRVYYELVRAGVNGSKILNMNLREGQFPIEVDSVCDERILRIAFKDGGGFGDLLIDFLLVQRIRSLLKNQCEITLYSKYENYFSRFSQINYSFPIDVAKYKLDYDLIISFHNLAIVGKMNRIRVKGKSQKLYEYCEKNRNLLDTLFSENTNNFRFTKYALLLGKNRIEQLDIYDLLGLTRDDRMHIPIVKEDLDCLAKYGLEKGTYVTINRDTGSAADESPKLWPIDYYIELLKFIKQEYPNITLVLIGCSQNPKLLPYVDIDLTKKTNLVEMNVILKFAFLHIGNEGGLVHLRHFLCGKSLVFWGATDVRVFGYRENINLFSTACDEHCEWLVDNWMKGCLKQNERYSCIKSVLPEKAKTAFREYVENKINFAVRLKVYSGDSLKYFEEWDNFTYHMPLFDNECSEKKIVKVRASDNARYMVKEAVRILAPGSKFILLFESGVCVSEICKELIISRANMQMNNNMWILEKEEL